MGESKGTVNIVYDDGNKKAKFDPPSPPTKQLEDNDWFDVKALPAELSIKAIEFFHSTHADPRKRLGSWTPGETKNIGSFFRVSGTTADAKIEDTESPGTDDTFYYKVMVDGPNAPTEGWPLDPQIINKKKT